MIENVKTTPTQAVQIWLKKSGAEMGWDHRIPWPDSHRAVAVGFFEPFDSFADFSHVLPYEKWRPEDQVRQVLSLCNCLPFRSVEQAADPKRLVFDNALEFFRTKTRQIFPDGTLTDHQNELIGTCWSIATMVKARSDLNLNTSAPITKARSCTFSPWRRAPASRLDPAGSGFQNLYLAGDWTWNDINIGCVEAAVI